MKEKEISVEALKKLIEIFHKLPVVDQAYILGYATHMAQAKRDIKKGA